MFSKILIANRGEIAVRIIKTCKAMGIPTLAVYSEIDRSSLHVQCADEAALLGPPPPLESYLNIDKIMALAQERGADAIHPGYGFLAENPKFAQRCEDEGIVFIGPPSSAIELLGSKTESRKTMMKAGIPCTPGFEIVGMELPQISRQAAEIGYPVLIKAAAGGGGKGMRIVRQSADLEKSLEGARRESKSAFADDTVYIEKYLEKPRHIEFQILGDKFGNIIHLCERECSIQRRYQKVVEETPSTAITPEIRAQMGQTAIDVAKASGYYNAGTVEFLYAGEGRYYFLEVNTRLQVEHPVTEFVIGLDLVEEQIRIAAGQPLRLKQDGILQRGHAIEVRIYAEDPAQNFMPSAGKILFMKEPTGPGIRHDCGVYSGWTVPTNYDPILSKLIAWAPSRSAAIERLTAALNDFPILGISTTVEFLAKVLQHPQFAAGNTFTDFIDQHFSGGKTPPAESQHFNLALLAAAIAETAVPAEHVGGAVKTAVYDPWQTVGAWQLCK